MIEFFAFVDFPDGHAVRVIPVRYYDVSISMSVNVFTQLKGRVFPSLERFLNGCSFSSARVETKVWPLVVGK